MGGRQQFGLTTEAIAHRPAVDTLSTHVWKLVLEAIASGYPLALLLMSFPQKHISCVDVLL